MEFFTGARHSLCKLLRYLAEHALDHPGSSLKEYQIATEVFGRPTELRSPVRFHNPSTGRNLRLKIAEYYASEGAEDQVQVEIPKGTYVLSFHRRKVSTARLRAVAQAAQHEEDVAEVRAGGRWKVAFLVLLAAIVDSWPAAAYFVRGDRANDRGAEPVRAA